MKRLTLILSVMLALVGFTANAAMYIVGNDPLGGWVFDGGVLMTDNGDGTFTHKATITGSVWFVFADGQGTSWDDFNGNYRYGPISGGNEVVNANTEYTTQKSTDGNASYQFTGSGEEYTFIFDSNSMQFKVVGEVEPPTENTWTVAGSSLALFGTSWDATNADNDMVKGNDGIYTWTNDRAELTTSGFSFKVVYNHDWGVAYPSSNYAQAISKHGYYKVVITFDEETKQITCTPTLLEEIIDEQDPIYTIAGAPAALFGTEWDPSLVENEMTKGQDGIYTWTKNNVELTAGNVEFKVVMGHEWGTEYPSSNYVATIDANGNYNVTITFNPENQEITFTAFPVEVMDDFYTVAGSPAKVFGTEWDPNYAANDMTLVNGVYTWTKEGVELAANDFIEFKVVKNANWASCWPAGNYEYTCTEDGTYNLTITFNPETEEVTFVATKQGEVVPTVRGDVNGDNEVSISDVSALIDYLLMGEDAPNTADCDLNGSVDISDVSVLIDYLLFGQWPKMVYTVAGVESVFGSNWDPTDRNNDMIEGEDGVYSWTKEGVTLYGNFEFKVVGNHDWAIYEWPVGFNNWVAVVSEEGVYTIVITFNPDAAEADRITCTLTKTGDVAPIEHTYTVAGTENLFGSDWDPTDTTNDMTKGDNGIYTWAKEAVNLTMGTEIMFKVVQDHAWDYAWPSSNWYYQVAEDGLYNIEITFDPNASDAYKVNFIATKLNFE